MNCINHTDREANYFCMKYARPLCEECLECQDPGLYCKFRPQCLIREFSTHPESRPVSDHEEISEHGDT